MIANTKDAAEVRKEILEKLAKAGLREGHLYGSDHWQHWLDCLVDYKTRGLCGSVNYSTVQFIPAISKLLDAIPTKTKTNS